MELTKQDLLSMTNMQKRKNFLESWATWDMWVDVPELGMTVRAVTLPSGDRITATRFDQHCTHYEHATLCLLRTGAGYRPRAASISELAEHLTMLRKEYATSGVVEYLTQLPRKCAKEDCKSS